MSIEQSPSVLGREPDAVEFIVRATGWLVEDPSNSHGTPDHFGHDVVCQEVRYAPDGMGRDTGSYFGTGGLTYRPDGDPLYTNDNSITVHDYDLPGLISGQAPDDPWFDRVPLVPGTNRVDKEALRARDAVVLRRMAATIVKTLEGVGKNDELADIRG